ncbi:glycoside hydrolase family 2 TIM barrel-domain containing protein [Bacteroides sp. 51]|uniref:glycoside hydrolase family 2 TIM barrel-domain containing protein n=1 Tax=Bacteroides sp. 51 TaxID=2302938 RepID=UPI0013D49901|nr:glycoside hydrolase family 2 TIM barrel-domain containing protein [Bacteroides sp. 51]NDV83893.1 beta-galactosidase [Bacteroides sp. 51]
MKRLILILAILCPLLAFAQQTETLYLSGKGLGDTKTWKFHCSEGRNSSKWTKIEVPSQWELQGFGEYCYGRWYTIKGAKPPMETGTYRTTFNIPSAWKGKQITIIFEGSMTDTEVKVNGQLAGEIHQGAFNRFSYDITDKIKTGKNELEVIVSKESSDRLVNAAERKADWWIFGGIYRPVYLEAKPLVNIERIAVDAKADGSLYADVFTTPLEEGYTLSASIEPVKPSGKQNIKQETSKLTAGTEHAVRFQWDNVEVWNTETPNLYNLKMTLLDQNQKLVHVYNERIGFRTVEFRVKDGIYVNGTKVVLKGINRHSFHPDGGRTTNKEISIMDGKLIKEMNINAVRFHYAPDKHFMEVCDSLGIFVVSELAGWQNAYGTEIGTKRVKELVTRDVNHPSIILWSNGNEGGFNYDLLPVYHQYDPQKRHIIHAWADFDNLDTHHYPTYLTGVARFTNGYKVFMPAEFQHGMYDQGHGAGLEDFWAQYTAHPLFAGGFMWDFSDNAVKRTDKGGILDSDGSNGTDGILGPYRQKEGSYYTVRDIWAPIQFEQQYITPSFKGEFIVRNDYLFSNLNTCRMEYRVCTAPSPLSKNKSEVIASGSVSLPAIDPREAGKARMQVPANFFEGDILEIKAWDRHNNEICTWTWPIHYAGEYTKGQIAKASQSGKAQVAQSGNLVTLSAGGVSISFNTANGLITEVKNDKGIVSFNNGPIPVGMKARLKEVKHRQEGNTAVFTAYYLGGVDSIRWEMSPAGLIRMHAVTLNRGSGGQGFDEAIFEDNITNFGFTFSYPEEKVEGMEWFGRGPYRVWRNRIRGANYGVWEKEYNNTITGADYSNLVYPEFKGYHGNMYWSTLNTTESPFTVYSGSDGVFMRVFTPEEPKDNKTNWSANPEFPEGDISFLYEIPGMRCFKPISQQGPKSQPSNIRIKKGDEGVHMELWFDFRPRGGAARFPCGGVPL